MGILAINIQAVRKRKGLTLEQLAELLNIGKTTLYNVETGYTKTLPDGIIEKLAAIFGTTVGGLLGNEPLVTDEGRAVYVTDSISYEKPFLELDKIVETVFIDEKELHGYKYIGLKVKDNAMCNEKIFLGDTVVVRQNAILKNGDIAAVVMKDNDGIVRKYFCEEDTVILKPCTNVGEYEEIRLKRKKDGNDGILAIGKVVKVIRDL